MRAGPLSGERIIRLINRRFVPFYFDLSNSGAAGDAAARSFITTRRKELAGASVPTPPVLFITPEGEIVGEMSNYAPPDEFLAGMLAVLKKHPKYNRPGPEESKATTNLEKGKILLELQSLDEAARLLQSDGGEEAHYLLGQMARRRGDWEAMGRHFERVRRVDLSDDVRMEKAYRLWADRAFDPMDSWLEAVPPDSNRFVEAQYYRGLALFHQGKKDEAFSMWKRNVEEHPEGPWVYRSDWAYTEANQGRRSSFRTSDRKTSILKRIGYMGQRPNADLQGPQTPAGKGP